MADNLFTKIKKANIPNSYYLLIVIAFFSVIVVGYAVSISGQKQEIEESVAEENSRTESDLSRRVREDITLGMSRSEVVRRLGLPTWAVLWGDKGVLSTPAEEIALELRWQNPSCREVVVMFSPRPFNVIGWDDGAHFCDSGLPMEGREAYRCTRPDRQPYCQ